MVNPNLSQTNYGMFNTDAIDTAIETVLMSANKKYLKDRYGAEDDPVDAGSFREDHLGDQGIYYALTYPDDANGSFVSRQQLSNSTVSFTLPADFSRDHLIAAFKDAMGIDLRKEDFKAEVESAPPQEEAADVPVKEPGLLASLFGKKKNESPIHDEVQTPPAEHEAPEERTVTISLDKIFGKSRSAAAAR